jgi:hypothetical protein
VECLVRKLTAANNILKTLIYGHNIAQAVQLCLVLELIITGMDRLYDLASYIVEY